MAIEVGCDDQGCFNANTGEDVMLEYDAFGRAYNAFTGEEVGSIVNATRDVLIGIFGRQGYPPVQGYPRGSQYPLPYPTGQYYPQQGASPGGVTQGGFTLNWWAAALIGVVAGAFFLGRRR